MKEQVLKHFVEVVRHVELLGKTAGISGRFSFPVSLTFGSLQNEAVRFVQVVTQHFAPRGQRVSQSKNKFLESENILGASRVQENCRLCVFFHLKLGRTIVLV